MHYYDPKTDVVLKIIFGSRKTFNLNLTRLSLHNSRKTHTFTSPINTNLTQNIWKNE